MPRIDLSSIAPVLGGTYPPEHNAPLEGRSVLRLSDAAGLTDLVANHVTLPPGCCSSQRHWHANEDELVVILSGGGGVLIDETGRTPLAAGDVAMFRKNDGNGHMIRNEGDTPLVMLAVGRPENSRVTYSDIDLVWTPEGGQQRRDGTPYG